MGGGQSRGLVLYIGLKRHTINTFFFLSETSRSRALIFVILASASGHLPSY